MTKNNSKNNKKKNRRYTKDEIRTFLKKWDELTLEEIAERVCRSKRIN